MRKRESVCVCICEREKESAREEEIYISQSTLHIFDLFVFKASHRSTHCESIDVSELYVYGNDRTLIRVIARRTSHNLHYKRVER